jgi:hypothetical protein
VACLRLTLGGRSGRPLTHSSYTTDWDTTCLSSAAFLLFAGSYFDWTFFVVPSWVLLVSADILADNFRK